MSCLVITLVTVEINNIHVNCLYVKTKLVRIDGGLVVAKWAGVAMLPLMNNPHMHSKERSCGCVVNTGVALVTSDSFVNSLNVKV